MPNDSGRAPSTPADKRSPRDFEFRGELAGIVGGADASGIRASDGGSDPPSVEPFTTFGRDGLVRAFDRGFTPRKLKAPTSAYQRGVITSRRSGMLKNLPDLSVGTFDFIESVQRLATPAEIVEAMLTVLSGFGVEYLCFNFLPDATQKFEDVLLANWVPPGWLELYVEQEFVHADPSIRFSRPMRRPYRWFKDCPYNPEQEPRAHELVQRAADFGLLDGIIIPLAQPARLVGHVWAGGHALELTGDTWPSVHLMALYAFDRVLRLRRPSSNEKPCLTSREREVLTLAAVGKPAWEIGDMLHISKRTANAHMASARGKLGAANRTQAVMIALRDGIIQP